MIIVPQKDIDRFWSKVEKTSYCWNWTAGSRNPHLGYGEFKWQGRNYIATRFLWMLEYGVAPGSLSVLHRCDNPRCVNPDHLFLGTDKDNMTDKATKKRGNAPKGEKHGRVKLTADMVRDIRSKYAAHTHTLTQLAQEYSVAFQHISGIVNRRFWRHID